MRQVSRLARYRSKQDKRQALAYLGLSLVFVFLIIRFGVPGFIQLVSWWTGKDAQKQEVDLGIPPQPPVLGDVPVATFSSQIKVEGFAMENTTVKLSVDGEAIDEVAAGDDGNFVFEKISLKEGKNELSFVTINEKDKESQPTKTTVTYDKTAPEIEILEPQNEAQVVGVAAQNISIKGKVDSNETEVRVNGNFVIVGSDEHFEYRTRLSPGLNEFVITAVDEAGNKSELLLRVNFSL